jgi:hypothetical protein
MAFLMVHVPRTMDIAELRHNAVTDAELKFWKGKADDLQRGLENIWERAQAGERVTLYRGSDQIELRPAADGDPQ